MKALLYDGPGKVHVGHVPDARIEGPTDVLVRITSTNICGSDLHRYLCGLITAGRANPSWIVSHELSLEEAPAAYRHFNARDHGWTKVILHP